MRDETQGRGLDAFAGYLGAGDNNVALSGGLFGCFKLGSLLTKLLDVIVNKLFGHLDLAGLDLDAFKLWQLEIGHNLHLKAVGHVAGFGQFDLLYVDVGFTDGLEAGLLQRASERLADHRVLDISGNLLAESLFNQPLRRSSDAKARNLRRGGQFAEHLFKFRIDPLARHGYDNLSLQGASLFDCILVFGQFGLFLLVFVLGFFRHHHLHNGVSSRPDAYTHASPAT